MCSERQRLEQKITSIQDEIRELPNGKLICVRNGNYTKWFQSDGHKCTYIPRKNRKLAEQLAAKKYLSLQKEELLQEQKAIDFYLSHHSTDCRAHQLLSDHSGYSELLSPFFTPSSQELLEWMNSPYEHNQMYPEQLIQKTGAGIYVRSKSEAIIVMLLHIHKVPFRYECALHLENNVIYPDFTIRHPQTGQIFYWEHFGMMDNPNYCQNTFSKLQTYASNGIYPSHQLITTYETKDYPLDSGLVETIIKHYFL
ncbi:MAG: ATPase [Roseburia sp.]|nr:ATPase [Roseburia sp.]